MQEIDNLIDEFMKSGGVTESIQSKKDNLVVLATYRGYKMAMAFGGLATPPLTLSGSLHKKKVHLFRLRHSIANLSKSNISPMGHPHPDRRTSCK